MADLKFSQLDTLDKDDLHSSDKVIVLDVSDTSGTGGGPGGTPKQYDPKGFISFEQHDVEFVSLQGISNNLSFKDRLIQALNTRPNNEVTRPRLYVISGSIGYTYVNEVYMHLAGPGFFGVGGVQMGNSPYSPSVTLLEQTLIDTEGDVNDLEVTSSIQDSINNGPEYITDQRRVFRRTIGGDVLTYAYLGSQAIIGGSQPNVVAGDFTDITADGNTSGGSVDADTVVVDSTPKYFSRFQNDPTVFGWLLGSDYLKGWILKQLGVDAEFDELSDHGTTAELIANQSNHTSGNLQLVRSPLSVYKYLGTTVGDITDYEEQSLSGGGSGFLESVVRTGDVITLDAPADYNEVTPATGNFTVSNTGQKKGVVVANYHKSATKPTITGPGNTVLRYDENEYVNDDAYINVFYISATASGNYNVSIKSYAPSSIIENYDYVQEVDDVIAAATTASHATSSAADLKKFSDFIEGLKNLRNDADTANTDYFSTRDRLFFFFKSTDEFAKYNFVTGAQEAVSISAIAHEADKGFRGATNDAINIVGNLETGSTNFTQNDASVVIYQSEQSNTGYMLGALNSSFSERVQIGANDSGSWFLGLNDDGAVHVAAYQAGITMLDRSGSTHYKFRMHDGTTSIITEASTGVPDAALYGCARQLSGAANTPTDGVLGFYMDGSSMDDSLESLATLINDTLLS